MKILFIILSLVVVGTYVYTSYRLYKSKRRPSIWEFLVIVLIPIWGCLIYLLLENRRTMMGVSRKQASR